MEREDSRALSPAGQEQERFVSRAEANAALSDSSITGEDAAAVAALHKFVGALEELSNDEFGDENDGMTLADLAAYEKGVKLKKLGPDVKGLEDNHKGAKAKITGTKRELFPNGVPSLSALRQGPIGDCYFLAALGSYIARDPKALTRMIQENKQGKRVTSYMVTFPGKLGAVTICPPTDGEIA